MVSFFRTYANTLSLVSSSTACVNRQALLERGGFPIGVKRGEDIIAWTRLASGGVMVHKRPPTAVYNQEAENRSTLLRETRFHPVRFSSLAQRLRSRESSADVREGGC